MSKRVPASGRPDSRLVVVGECPGKHEVRLGRPFVGPSGYTLERWWSAVGLRRSDFWIDNVFPYRAPQDTIGKADHNEVEDWADHLHTRIAKLTDPWLIVPTGNVALRALMRRPLWRNDSPKIGDWRGSIMEYERADGTRVKMIPTIHPAATFRQPSLAKLCKADWARIVEEQHTRTSELPKRFHLVPPVKAAEVYRFVARAENPTNVLAIDIETNPETRNILCVGFSDDPHESITLPWDTENYVDIKRLCQSACQKILQNGHYDCVTGQAEVLTPSGWVRFNRLEERKRGLVIAQWQTDGTIEWVKPTALIKRRFDGELVCADTRALSIATTPKHRIVHTNPNAGSGFSVYKAEEAFGQDLNLPISGVLESGAIDIPWVQLLVAIQADAHLKPTYATLHLTKTRKRRRLLELCNSFGVLVTEKRRKCGDFEYIVTGPLARMAFGLLGPDRLWGPWVLALAEQTRSLLLNELKHWDGNIVSDDTFKYSTKHKTNADWVATIAHVVGKAATIGQSGTGWVVTVRNRDKHRVTPDKWYRRAHHGEVYCVSVPSGFFLIRYHDRISVTGNCFWLAEEGIRVRNWQWDTLAMHHAIDATLPHDLATMASLYTRQPFWKRDAKDEDTMVKMDLTKIDALYRYCGVDACVTRELYDVFRGRFDAAA